MMVFEKISQIIGEQVGRDVEEITPDTNFREDLDADSLDLFQIINDIEEEFGVQIEDAEQVITVADAVKLVEEQLKL